MFRCTPHIIRDITCHQWLTIVSFFFFLKRQKKYHRKFGRLWVEFVVGPLPCPGRLFLGIPVFFWTPLKCISFVPWHWLIRVKYTFEKERNPSHMSNTLDWIPVDKTWSPMESGRRMKPEAQSSPLELPEV